MSDPQPQTAAPRPQVRILFVCGSPKSGTTWVQRLFDAHPEIVCSGEGHFIEKLLLPMIEVFRNYNRHLKLVEERVYQGRPYYQPLPGAELDALLRSLMLRIMAQRGIKPTARWLGDKTPRYTNHLPHLLRLFPGCRIVHVVRDVRDVAVSRLHHAFRAGDREALTPGTASYYTHVENAATAWKAQVGAARSFVVQHPEPCREVRYEDLLADTPRHFATLLAFLGVDASPEAATACALAADFRTLSGRERGEEDPTSFFRKGIAGDWHERLDAKALALLTTHCGALMAELGYQQQ